MSYITGGILRRQKQMDVYLDPYQVVEGEQAGVLGQQVGTKLSSAKRQEHTWQGVTILWFDLQHSRRERESTGYRSCQ